MPEVTIHPNDLGVDRTEFDQAQSENIGRLPPELRKVVTDIQQVADLLGLGFRITTASAFFENEGQLANMTAKDGSRLGTLQAYLEQLYDLTPETPRFYAKRRTDVQRLIGKVAETKERVRAT